jgi:hypothetical protein
MNLPYAMIPAIVIDMAKAFRLKILYLYGETNISKILDLLKDVEEIEIQVWKRSKKERRGIRGNPLRAIDSSTCLI